MHGALGQPEAVLSEDVAQNLGLKVGDILSRPDSEDSFAPIPIRLVGVLRGRVWLGLTSKSLVDANSPFTWSGYLAFAPTADEAQQRRLDDADIFAGDMENASGITGFHISKSSCRWSCVLDRFSRPCAGFSYDEKQFRCYPKSEVEFFVRPSKQNYDPVSSEVKPGYDLPVESAFTGMLGSAAPRSM